MNLSRSLTSLVVAMVCVLLTAPAVLAADPAASKDQGENTPVNLGDDAADKVGNSSGGGVVRTIVGLAVVLAVIYGLHWVLKQVKAGREQHSDGAGLETIATLALGPGRSVHLIRTGREYVLVGASEQGVTTIRVFDEDEARRLGLLDPDGDPFGRSGPSGGGRGRGPGPRALLASGGGSSGARGALVERVRRLTVRG